MLVSMLFSFFVMGAEKPTWSIHKNKGSAPITYSAKLNLQNTEIFATEITANTRADALKEAKKEYKDYIDETALTPRSDAASQGEDY